MADEGLAIEVGPRTMPFITELRKDLLRGEKIVYFEKRHGWIKELSGVLKGRETAIQGHGSNLPLPDSSVSTIFAKDLFGAHGKIYLSPKGRVSLSETEDIGKGLAKEWFRVCRPGGKVVILEVSTPADKDALKSEFASAGFEVSEEYKEEKVGEIFEEKEAFRAMGFEMSKAGYKPYAIVFKKPTRS